MLPRDLAAFPTILTGPHDPPPLARGHPLPCRPRAPCPGGRAERPRPRSAGRFGVASAFSGFGFAHTADVRRTALTMPRRRCGRTARWCWWSCGRMASCSYMPRRSCRRIARWCWRRYGRMAWCLSVPLRSCGRTARWCWRPSVQQNGLVLCYASEELRADREVALTAVQQNGFALYHASQALQADREVVLAAVKQDGTALKCASDELWVDREVVLAAMQQGGGAPEYASEELWALRADREVVLAAVQQNGLALGQASEELRADHEVVLAAVQQAGEALEYASEELRTDREVVLAAVRHENSTGWGRGYSHELDRVWSGCTVVGGSSCGALRAGSKCLGHEARGWRGQGRWQAVWCGVDPPPPRRRVGRGGSTARGRLPPHQSSNNWPDAGLRSHGRRTPSGGRGAAEQAEHAD
eukprot:scaffold30148_cov56-Phaeocystis_antarctica.AAC.2